MAAIHLIEGPVGAGKSTYAAQLAFELGAPHLDLDEWMVNLFRPDRPETDFMSWYAARKQRCLEQIWRVTEAVLDSGSDVVLELGLVRRADREHFYARADAADRPVAVHLLDAPADLRWKRVARRNEEAGATFKMAVSREIFELASGAWEPPGQQEIDARSMRLVDC